eukprot:5892973-Pyramimonas_sp.AAC.1
MRRTFPFTAASRLTVRLSSAYIPHVDLIGVHMWRQAMMTLGGPGTSCGMFNPAITLAALLCSRLPRLLNSGGAALPNKAPTHYSMAQPELARENHYAAQALESTVDCPEKVNS